jgi:ABC-type Fe3+-hydroxamate transport system substrate-binding protein
LWEWVPEKHRDEDIPCHFIPLNERGESITSLEDAKDREEAEKALLQWLNSAIEQLEAKLAGQQAGLA